MSYLDHIISKRFDVSVNTGYYAKMENKDQEFSEELLINKVKRYAGKIGCKGICVAFQLFFALKNPKLPAWAKIRILGSLAYFISFVDAIPDLLPGVGYTDDILVLIATAATVAFYIDEDVKNKSQIQVKNFFKDCDCAKVSHSENPSQSET